MNAHVHVHVYIHDILSLGYKHNRHKYMYKHIKSSGSNYYIRLCQNSKWAQHEL